MLQSCNVAQYWGNSIHYNVIFLRNFCNLSAVMWDVLKEILLSNIIHNYLYFFILFLQILKRNKNVLLVVHLRKRIFNYLLLVTILTLFPLIVLLLWNNCFVKFLHGISIHIARSREIRKEININGIVSHI